jgi:hypothetical protein
LNPPARVTLGICVNWSFLPPPLPSPSFATLTGEGVCALITAERDGDYGLADRMPSSFATTPNTSVSRIPV